MSDGMGRELAYLSSHATNRYFIPNWGKNRSWLSDKDCQSLGRDKLKNASILRKYESIFMEKKTRNFSLRRNCIYPIIIM